MRNTAIIHAFFIKIRIQSRRLTARTSSSLNRASASTSSHARLPPPPGWRAKQLSALQSLIVHQAMTRSPSTSSNACSHGSMSTEDTRSRASHFPTLPSIRSCTPARSSSQSWRGRCVRTNCRHLLLSTNRGRLCLVANVILMQCLRVLAIPTQYETIKTIEVVMKPGISIIILQTQFHALI